MALRFIYYILVTVISKDRFLIHGEPTIDLHELLDEKGFAENNIIVELDADYKGSTKIIYKWDELHNSWQRLN